MNVTFKQLITRSDLTACAWILYSYCCKLIRVFAKLVKVLQIVKLPSHTAVECPHHPNVWIRRFRMMRRYGLSSSGSLIDTVENPWGAPKCMWCHDVYINPNVLLFYFSINITCVLCNTYILRYSCFKSSVHYEKPCTILHVRHR